jgi:hypothetical protein
MQKVRRGADASRGIDGIKTIPNGSLELTRVYVSGPVFHGGSGVHVPLPPNLGIPDISR